MLTRLEVYDLSYPLDSLVRNIVEELSNVVWEQTIVAPEVRQKVRHKLYLSAIGKSLNETRSKILKFMKELSDAYGN